MNFSEALEKIAGDEVDSIEKLAACYDEIGREMARGMFKEAAKLPPGMFSGRAGIMKLLAGAGIGGGAYATGKYKAGKDAEKDDVEIAQGAYQAGVRRGAQAVIQQLKNMRQG
jgi:hypothetical protein